jgi:hypothetical protein
VLLCYKSTALFKIEKKLQVRPAGFVFSGFKHKNCIMGHENTLHDHVHWCLFISEEIFLVWWAFQCVIVGWMVGKTKRSVYRKSRDWNRGVSWVWKHERDMTESSSTVGHVGNVNTVQLPIK